MKTMLCVILTGTLFAAVAAAQTAAPSNKMPALRETTEIGTQSLDTLRKLVNEQNYAAMGFRSAKEVEGAKLGAPMQVFAVKLDDLRKFQAGTNPDSLLAPLEKVVFPVLVGEEVRSSVTVEKSREKWAATNFGGAKFIQALEKARRQVLEGAAGADTFLVHLSALNSYFVGFRATGKLMLAAIVDLPDLELVAGRVRPAEEVFTTLAPIAQRYNGLPL